MRVCMLLERPVVRYDSRVRREVRALTAAGHEVVLLHHGPRDRDDAAVADGAVTRTVAGRRPRTARLTARMPGPLRRAWRLLSFAVLAARSGAGAIHAHDLAMLPSAWLAARLSGAWLVFDTHEYPAGVTERGPLARWVTRGLLAVLVARCDAVIAVSDAVAERLRADHRLARRPVVVRNVADDDWADPAPAPDLRAQLGVGTAPLVLWQGVAQRSRGAGQLVAALERVPEAHLLFLGDPVEDLLPLVRSHRVAGRVHFRPSVDPAVLLAHTRQADVGICMVDPSFLNHRLTLTNKAFEYIAAGVPVLATAATESGALVRRHGVGWTAPFGDVPALVTTLGVAVAEARDEALRERVGAAGRVLRWSVEQQRLLALYEDLRSRSSRSQPARTSR